MCYSPRVNAITHLSHTGLGLRFLQSRIDFFSNVLSLWPRAVDDFDEMNDVEEEGDLSYVRFVPSVARSGSVPGLLVTWESF
jgi:hypothetical protein